MDSLLPCWAVDETPRGPAWTVDDMTSPLDITLATDIFYALALVSRRMSTIATPYLYRIIHVRNIQTLLFLWVTLCSRCPSNAAHVRHVLFGVPLSDLTTTQCSRADVVRFLMTERAGKGRSSGARFRWADGHALVYEHVASRAPTIVQRVCFDISTRCAHAQSIGFMPPSYWDANACFGFRQALDMLASASLLQPTTIVLDRLRAVTLQIRNSCSGYLSAYGTLRLPLLRRLILVSEPEMWFLDLHVRTKDDRSTVLEKLKSLTIVPGSRSPRVNSDLKVDFQSLPHLEDLAIFLHSTHLERSFLWATLAPPADLNPQLGQHARGLRALDLSWRLEPGSPVWSHLGTIRRLACLPRLCNLVKLQISTQVLFRSLSQLQQLLRPAAHADHQTEDQQLSKLLGYFPDTLQLLVLTEWWPATELGLLDVPCAITLDTWHGRGDWMEARYREEAHAAGGSGRPPEDMIHTAHDVAILGLMRVLCQKWLCRQREARAVELRPQNPYFYGTYTHHVLLATEGLQRLLSRRESRQGHEIFSYSFVPAVYLRSVGVAVDAARP